MANLNLLNGVQNYAKKCELNSSFEYFYCRSQILFIKTTHYFKHHMFTFEGELICCCSF